VNEGRQDVIREGGCPVFQQRVLRIEEPFKKLILIFGTFPYF
jgi:hypothetical protein